MGCASTPTNNPEIDRYYASFMEEKEMPDSLNMPKGSVRAILAFTLVWLFAFIVIWMVVKSNWMAVTSMQVLTGVTPMVKEIVLLALVFYFMKGKAKEGGE